MINLKSIMSSAIRKEKIILGLDPGTQIMGYAVLQSIDSNLEVLQFDLLYLQFLSFGQTLAIMLK